MKALFDSFVRTIVPILVANVIAFLAGLGLALDSEFQGSLTAVLTGALAAL